jgi:hypothetical protein
MSLPLPCVWRHAFQGGGYGGELEEVTRRSLLLNKTRIRERRLKGKNIFDIYDICVSTLPVL